MEKKHHDMKQLTLTTFSMTQNIWCNTKCVFSRKICIILMTQL